MKDDLDNISEMLIEFFKQKRTSTTISQFKDAGITGWEKWWQMEFALFLSEHEKISEWDIEHPFDTDKRTSLAQNRMALDVGFRLKRQRVDEWYFIELKQAPSYKECIDRMAKDADKVFSARKKSFDGVKIRYIACAGIFLKEDEEKVMDHAEEALSKFGVDCDDGFFIEEIDEHHMLLIF